MMGQSRFPEIIVINNEINKNIVRHLFPNPNAGEISIQLNFGNETTYNIEVLDLLGNVVYQRLALVEKNKSLLKINIRELSNGVYFLKIGPVGADIYSIHRIVLEKGK